MLLRRAKKTKKINAEECTFDGPTHYRWIFAAHEHNEIDSKLNSDRFIDRKMDDSASMLGYTVVDAGVVDVFVHNFS